MKSGHRLLKSIQSSSSPSLARELSCRAPNSSAIGHCPPRWTATLPPFPSVKPNLSHGILASFRSQRVMHEGRTRMPGAVVSRQASSTVSKGASRDEDLSRDGMVTNGGQDGNQSRTGGGSNRIERESNAGHLRGEGRRPYEGRKPHELTGWRRGQPSDGSLEDIAKVLIKSSSESLCNELNKQTLAPKEWTIVLKSIAENNVDRACDILRLASIPPTPVSSSLASGGKIGRGVLVPDRIHFNSVMSKASEVGGWDKVSLVYNIMKEAKITPDDASFCTLMICRARQGERSDIELLERELLDAIGGGGQWQTLRVFNARIFACSKHGRWADCQALMSKMAEAGLNRDDVTVANAVRCAGIAGETEAAFALWDEYTVEGRVPSSKCWDALVQTCGHAKDLPTALELVQRMQDLGVPIGSYTYVALFHACTSHTQVRLVKEILAENRVEISVPMQIAILMMCGDAADAGDVTQVSVALSIFEQMRESAHHSRLPHSAYNAVIAVCGIGGDIRKAFVVYEWMLHDGLVPREDTYQAIITACQRTGSLRDAMRMFEVMNQAECGVNRAAYNSLISACAKGMDWMMAEEVYDNMKLAGITPDVVTFNSLISAYVSGVVNGETYDESASVLAKGHGVLTEMRSRGIRPTERTYGSLFHLCSRGAEPDKALEYWEVMLSEGITPKWAQYNTIIDAVWDSYPEKGYELFRRGLDEYGTIFQEDQVALGKVAWTLDLRRFSGGAAQAAIVWWIREFLAPCLGAGRGRKAAVVPLSVSVNPVLQRQIMPFSRTVDVCEALFSAPCVVTAVPRGIKQILVGWGGSRKAWKEDTAPSVERVEMFLEGMDTPMRHGPFQHQEHGGRIELDAPRLGQWISHALLCTQTQAWHLRAS